MVKIILKLFNTETDRILNEDFILILQERLIIIVIIALYTNSKVISTRLWEPKTGLFVAQHKFFSCFVNIMLIHRFIILIILNNNLLFCT